MVSLSLFYSLCFSVILCLYCNCMFLLHTYATNFKLNSTQRKMYSKNRNVLSLQAYAGARFTGRLLQAMGGAKDIVECAFVENTLTAAPFFSTPVRTYHSCSFAFFLRGSPIKKVVRRMDSSVTAAFLCFKARPWHRLGMPDRLVLVPRPLNLPQICIASLCVISESAECNA